MTLSERKWSQDNGPSHPDDLGEACLAAGARRLGPLLARGTGSAGGLAEYGQGISYRGKTVCDLGCNLGYFSFLAARDGAALVEGLDVDPRVIEGAGLLADMQGLSNVRFRTADFTAETPERPFDMVLVIDFIGRGTVVKGRLGGVLDAAARFSAREMVFTLRPIYACADLAPCGQRPSRTSTARRSSGTAGFSFSTT